MGKKYDVYGDDLISLPRMSGSNMVKRNIPGI